MPRGVQALGPNPFTISDLSYVWVVCDVYENDLPSVRLGDTADIRLNAYPDQSLQGTDQQHRRDSRSQHSHGQGAHRGAQSRASCASGMFATATFHGQKAGNARRGSGHPRSCICTTATGSTCPRGDNKFRRVEVVGGDTLPEQHAGSSLRACSRASRSCTNALGLQNTVDNE